MDALRRAIVGGLAGLALEASTRRLRGDEASGASSDLTILDLSVEGDPALGRRFTLLVPKHLGANERVPLLVLLHGLGETGDERMGAHAWIERYGLVSSYERLRRPPVVRLSRRPDFTEAHLAEVNAGLAARPFRGLAIACPYTPNVNRLPNPAAALDGYARWIVETVVPRARKEAPALTDAGHTALDGCSLGGYIGLEVFLRQWNHFGAWGGVQSAFGARRASAFAERLARAVSRASARTIHLETSTEDPFRKANEVLSTELTRRGVRHELVVLPGPHDQPWLREVGTLEALRFYDRALRAP